MNIDLIVTHVRLMIPRLASHQLVDDTSIGTIHEIILRDPLHPHNYLNTGTFINARSVRFRRYLVTTKSQSCRARDIAESPLLKRSAFEILRISLLVLSGSCTISRALCSRLTVLGLHCLHRGIQT